MVDTVSRSASNVDIDFCSSKEIRTHHEQQRTLVEIAWEGKQSGAPRGPGLFFFAAHEFGE
ncbi:MAG: hypothetical protein C0483_02705 [Pirellula sp.]|nr:hypothetical protein [Pirellula sp.]